MTVGEFIQKLYNLVDEGKIKMSTPVFVNCEKCSRNKFKFHVKKRERVEQRTVHILTMDFGMNGECTESEIIK